MSVLYESVDNIALITINRPEKRNAMNAAVVTGLIEAWARFEQSDEQVAVLTGAGDQAFCVGADLSDMPGEVWRALPNFSVPCDKPIIAATTGYVIGVGSSLTLYSDMIVASETTQFIYPEAKVGVFQGIMGGFPKKMPYAVGLEWTTTGEPMSAERAHQIGFVNEVCPAGKQVEHAMALARKIANNAPLVVRTMKHLALQTLPVSPMDTYYPHKRRLDQIAQSLDASEGVRAFSEKRKPRFQGR